MAKYMIMIRQEKKPRKVAQADNETTAKRLRDEWVNRLIDDGHENPEESVYVVMK